jgi:hypothetical protein
LPKKTPFCKLFIGQELWLADRGRDRLYDSVGIEFAKRANNLVATGATALMVLTGATVCG